VAGSSRISTQKLEALVRQVEHGMCQIKTPTKVMSEIRGVGLKSTITALVRFSFEEELRKVLDMERQIKESAGVSVRDFAGHISLAYFVRHPGRQIRKIKEILRPYRGWIGDLGFSKFDLTYFTDMNTYVPLLTVDLDDGSVTRYEDKLEAAHQNICEQVGSA
jgi:hypothetical protein